MSPRAMRLPLALAWLACVVDQIDGEVAAIELAESELITLPLRCLPPAPREGERLEARRAPSEASAPHPSDCLYQLRRPRGDGPPTTALASSLRDVNPSSHNPTHRRQP